MTGIVFNKVPFFRTIAVFLFLTIFWTILCVFTDEFTKRDKGLISGLGFLLLLSVSIYFGQKLKHLVKLGYLTLLPIFTFLIASFVIGPLIGGLTNSMFFYSVVSSLFVSFSMTFFLDKIIEIHFKAHTIVLTFLFLLVAYFIDEKISENLYFKYGIHLRITMFNIFQLALILPLTLGMTLKRINQDG